jgi:hypothetical protein
MEGPYFLELENVVFTFHRPVMDELLNAEIWIESVQWEAGIQNIQMGGIPKTNFFFSIFRGYEKVKIRRYLVTGSVNDCNIFSFYVCEKNLL